MDDPSDSAKVVERYKLPFGILADNGAEMTRRYGVLHENGHPFGKGDIALPAHFLIDTTGQVAWSFVSRHPKDRPEVEEIRAAVDALGS